MTSRTRFLIFAQIGLLALAANAAHADDIIRGKYCYTYGDRESLKEAREITQQLAIRNAIESYRTFVVATAAVKNFQLTNDLVQMISSGYLKNMKTVEHTEKGREVCDTIEASISPQAVENILQSKIEEKIKNVEEVGLDNNGYMKILRVLRFVNSSKVTTGYGVVVRILARPSHSVLTEDKWKDSQKICVDFFDASGLPIGGKCDSPHSYGHFNPGQLERVDFTDGLAQRAASVKVWLMQVN